MHLETNTALDFSEGRLDRDQEAFWKQHMDVCDKCAKDVLQLQQLTKALKRPHLTSASKRDLDSVLHLFSPPKQEEPSTLRSLIAAIVFDSSLQPATSGIRGGPEETRQVIMRTEEFDIHIRIWNDGERWKMLGQLLPRQGDEFAQPARFHLLRGASRLETTITDESGEFYFAQVPEGEFSLQIDLPNLTMIGALTIKKTFDLGS